MNPHIIKKFNKISAKNKKQEYEEFLAKYNKAISILSKVKGAKVKNAIKNYLVFALEPTLKEIGDTWYGKDNIAISKVGGYPNMEYVRRHGRSLEEVWPRCNCCHKYMKFLCQMDESRWVDVIHYLTCKKGKTVPEWTYSSVGYRNNESALYKNWYTVFFCPEFHYDDPNCDAHILCNKLFSDISDIGSPKARKEAVAKALSNLAETKKFVKSNKIQVVEPILEIVDWNLKFELDLDIHTLEFPVCDCELKFRFEDIMEQNPDIFVEKTNLKMFGKPETQQEAPRWCSVRRGIYLSPWICWYDEEKDITNQFYADVQNWDKMHDIFAKLDSSCT